MPRAIPPQTPLAGVAICLMAVVAASALAGDDGLEMRVESEVFVDEDTTPSARSLTLFENGITWDFLDPVMNDGDAVGDVILHDPARERVVVLDGRRSMKTEIRTIRLERLNVSLTKWARHSDNPLIKWAGGPDFGDSLASGAESVALTGPRVRYAVDFTTAFGDQAGVAYRRFADTAILLKALMQPGGIPPFPRLAINRHVEAAGGIPTSVRLEIGPKLPFLPGGGQTLRSTHKVHPRLIGDDRSRIDAAAARVSVAEAVDLEEFVRRRTVDAPSHPGS